MHGYRLLCVSLGLIIYLQTSLSRTCDLEFKDVPSKTYQADFVFEATAHRLLSSGGGGAGKGSKDKSIVRFQVSDVYKGTLDKETNSDRYRTISVGSFGVKADQRRCIASVPQLGSRYVLFLRSAETDNGIRTTAKSKGDVQSPDFVLSSFPEPISDDVISSVRRSTDRKFARMPSVRMSTENLTFEPGTVARLQCNVSGRPWPKVNWFKDSVQLQSNKHVAFRDTKRRSSLVIRNLTRTDSGIYRCQAVNVVGNTSLNSTKGVFVSVIDKPRCDRDDYCFNGGKCFFSLALNRSICECIVGFIGKRCGEKDPDLPYALLRFGRDKPHSVHCQTDNYCFNGGKCFILPAINRRFCKCQSGFNGVRCLQKDPDLPNALLPFGRGTSRKRRLLLLKPYAM